MTRTYYESEIFRSFNAAYKMKRNLKTKFKIHCNLIYDGELSDPKNCRLTVTSVNDETKKELENALYDIRKQLQSDENKEAVSNKEESLLKDIEKALIEWFEYEGTKIDSITVKWIENEVLESEYELPYYFTLEFDDETFLKIAKYL